MAKPLISIIIPAHNAEKTIGRTIQSIDKEFGNEIEYEILVVENGSTDHTTERVKQIECKNIQLLSSSKGVSNARNLGIEKAHGKWIMFVDADDELIPESGKILRRIAKNSKADLCAFGHEKEKKQLKVCDRTEKYTVESIDEIRVRMLNRPTKYMQVWAKLFDRNLMIENNIRFDTRLRLSEDSDFTLNYIKYCRSIELYPECVYLYTLNVNSTMHTFDGEKVSDYAKAMDITGKKIADESEKIKDAYYQYVLTHFHIAMVNEVFSTSHKVSFRKKRDILKHEAENPVFQVAIQKTRGNSQSKLNFMMGMLLKNKWYYLTSLVYEVRAVEKAKA